MNSDFLFYKIALWATFFIPFICVCITTLGLAGKNSLLARPQVVLLLLFLSITSNWLCINLSFHIVSWAPYLLPLLYLTLLLVPVFFYHFIYLLTDTGGGERFSWKHYLVPALVLVAMLGWLTTVDYRAEYSDMSVSGDLTKVKDYVWFQMFAGVVRTAYSLLYLPLAWRRIRGFRKTVEDYASNRERASLGWLNVIFILFLVQIIVPLLAALIGAGRYREAAYTPITPLIALLLLWECSSLVYHFFSGNFVVIADRDSEPAGDSLEVENKNGARRQELKVALENYMLMQKPYLNSELKITDLTGILGTNRTYLSGFINETYGMNFCTLVNSYRLTEYEQLRSDSGNRQQTNAVLVLQAGFSGYKAYLRAKKSDGYCRAEAE